MKKITIETSTAGGRRGWRWIPASRTLLVPARLVLQENPALAVVLPFLSAEQRERYSWSKTDIYCLLHELGHAALGHVETSDTRQQLAQEEEAWEYAMSCLRSHEREEMWVYALTCLETYDPKYVSRQFEEEGRRIS